MKRQTAHYSFTAQSHIKSDFVHAYVIGGGIAGFSAAIAAAKNGYEVTLFEQDPIFFGYASSRNAAIARSYEADPEIWPLTYSSIRQMVSIPGVLRAHGLLIQPEEVDYTSEGLPVESEFSARDQKIQLPDSSFFGGKLIPCNGTVDLSILHRHLLNQAKSLGVRLVEKARLRQAKQKENHAEELILEIDFTSMRKKLGQNDIVILANGSWASEKAPFGLAMNLPVQAYKRHLFFLKGPSSPELPVLWAEREDVYVRPEPGGWLVSYCDETLAAPYDYHADEKAPERLASALSSVFPFLAPLGVRRYWACIRTFTRDNRPIFGQAPGYENVFLATGLGGRGVSLSLALADLLRDYLPGAKTAASSLPFSTERFTEFQRPSRTPHSP